MAAPLILTLTGFLVACATADYYALSDNWSGSGFFDNFDFFTGGDPTHGTVNYVDRGTAQASGLISTNGNAPVYMGADHTNWGGRNSVRITSKKAFNGGLFIVDLAHMPSGCGTWPAFWMTASDVNWPGHGEIDIIEGVNTNTANQATLHTTPGCDMSSVNKGSFTGNWAGNAVGGLSTNCDVNAANQYANAGCGVLSTQANSYGVPFNKNGGGVYATEWVNNDSGWIRTWFFPRNAIPSDISSGNPNPSSWGPPMTNFLFGGNCRSSHFANQQIIFDLTFCGDWAGATFNQGGCPGDCASYVQNNPGSFTEAYWIVNYVKSFGLVSGSSSGGSTSGGSTSGSCTIYNGQDYFGGDLTNGPQSSAAACCSWCSSTSGCKVWSYASGICYLKNQVNALVGNAAVTAGSIGAGSSGACTLHTGQDFYGGDLKNAPQSSAAACCSWCSSTSGCKVWSYAAGICYLKNSVNTLVNAPGCTAGSLPGVFLEQMSMTNSTSKPGSKPPVLPPQLPVPPTAPSSTGVEGPKPIAPVSPVAPVLPVPPVAPVSPVAPVLPVPTDPSSTGVHKPVHPVPLVPTGTFMEESETQKDTPLVKNTLQP